MSESSPSPSLPRQCAHSTSHQISIRSKRKPSLSTLLMLASAVPLGSISSMSHADDTTHADQITPVSQAEKPTVTLDTVVIESSSLVPFKKQQLINDKYTQPLLDTPQTITVITNEIIEEQKAFSLTDALRNTPGITMQMGENGRSSEGDAISIRGFSGNDLFLVDGIRNVGAVSRDTFNVESIEVTKGLAGAEVGRSASGGAINIVTKKPLNYVSRNAEISVDTEAKTRLAADINQPLSNDYSGRLNIMYEKGDAIDRDEVDIEQYGIAPSISWGLGTPTRVTASAEVFRARNTPDGGIPTVGMDGYFRGATDYTTADLDFSEFDYSLVDVATPEEVVAELNRANARMNSASKVNDKNYYGYEGDDEDVDSDVFSVFIDHDLNANTTFSNTTRYSKTTMKREVSAPYVTYNTPISIQRRSNIVEVNEDLASLRLDPNNPDTWRIRVIRQGVDRENETLGNFTNINLLDYKTGPLSHDITAGGEFIKEKQQNQGLTRPSVTDYPSLYNPDANMMQQSMISNASMSEGETKTIAAYVFDTIAINNQLDVMLGGRLDDYRTEYKSRNEEGITNKLKDNDTLYSYKGAITFKPTPQSSIYANYGHTETPPGGSNFTLSNSGRSELNPASNPVFDPQETKSWEIGTKWELLDDRLLLALAYYNTKHEDELAQQDSLGNYVQFGEREVDGVEFSAQGEITPGWRVNFGIQTMDTEIKEGTSGRSAEGAEARWSPELTGTLWTSYDFNDRFTLGGGVRYVDEQKRQTDPSADLALTAMPVIDDYVVIDAFASYRINDEFSADLNVYNLFDEDYLETLNNGGVRASKGEPLNAMLTLKYNF